MRCLRSGRRRRLLLALMLAPPVLWALLLTITPTEWARNRVVAKLAKKSGRSISMGRLWIGFFGGLHLCDLAIGAPTSATDPWLRVRSARINVSAVQLLMGQVEPTEIIVDGLDLRVLRRPDGTLELADLLRPAARREADLGDGECHAPLTGLEVRLRDARLTLIDEPSRTRLALTNVDGWASWEGPQATLHELRGTVNNGPFELSGTVDRAEGGPEFEANIRARSVALGGATSLLAYLLPVLAESPEAQAVDGHMDLDFYVRGKGASRQALVGSLIGQGTVRIDPVTLDGSRLMEALHARVDLPSQTKVGSVKADLKIRDGRISSDNLTLELGKVPLVLSGWTDFERRVDYRVRVDRLTSRLPERARDFLSDLSVDLDEIANLHLAGTLDTMNVSVEGAALGASTNDPGRTDRLDDRQKMRELGKRFRDRLLR